MARLWLSILQSSGLHCVCSFFSQFCRGAAACGPSDVGDADANVCLSPPCWMPPPASPNNNSVEMTLPTPRDEPAIARSFNVRRVLKEGEARVYRGMMTCRNRA